MKLGGFEVIMGPDGSLGAGYELTENLQWMTGAAPEYLWHYTNGGALLNILKTKALWATHIRYLNDGREFIYALELAREDITRRLAGNLIEEDARPALQQAHDRLATTGVGGDADVFVCSLTAQGDQLSQWRGYTSPGDAYCLGLPTLYLLSRSLTNWQLRECIYGEEQHRAAIEYTINGSLGRLAADKVDEFVADLVGGLTAIAPDLKHASFKEEEEWRLVRYPPQFLKDPTEGNASVEFRAGHYSIIPYTEWPLVRDDMGKFKAVVRVGPGPYPELSGAAVLERARSLSAEIDIDVVISNQALRIW